jgi:hypothetical protein
MQVEDRATNLTIPSRALGSARAPMSLEEEHKEQREIVELENKLARAKRNRSPEVGSLESELRERTNALIQELEAELNKQEEKDKHGFVLRIDWLKRRADS